MSIYSTIERDVWTEVWFEPLSMQAKLFFFYLATNPKQTPCGAFSTTRQRVCLETSMTWDQVEAATKELGDRVVYWPEHQVFWLVKFYKRQRANSNPTNYDKAALAATKNLPSCAQARVFLEYPELAPTDSAHPTHTQPIPNPLSTDPIPTGEHKHKHKHKHKQDAETGDMQRAPDSLFETRDNFEEFYRRFMRLYPARNGKRPGLETEAKQAARKVSSRDWDDVLLAAKNYAASGEMPVDPVRFFISRRFPNGLWREWLTPAKPGAGLHIAQGVEVDEHGDYPPNRDYAWERSEDGRWKQVHESDSQGLLPYGLDDPVLVAKENERRWREHEAHNGKAPVARAGAA